MFEQMASFLNAGLLLWGFFRGPLHTVRLAILEILLTGAK